MFRVKVVKVVTAIVQAGISIEKVNGVKALKMVLLIQQSSAAAEHVF